MSVSMSWVSEMRPVLASRAVTLRTVARSGIFVISISRAGSTTICGGAASARTLTTGAVLLTFTMAGADVTLTVGAGWSGTFTVTGGTLTVMSGGWTSMPIDRCGSIGAGAGVGFGPLLFGVSR